MTTTLSIIVPCYNESATLERVVEALEHVSLPSGWERELIVIDDGSRDGTAELLQKFEGESRVRAFFHTQNKGKGAAVKTGLRAATGEYILIQDADAEYDPHDIPRLIEALKEGDSIFGSRNLGTNNVPYNAIYFYGGLFVTKLFNFLFRTRFTDIASCYKLFPRRFVPALLASDHDDFVFDAVHLTLTLSRGGTIAEVPILYKARRRNEGKKLTTLHAAKIVLALLLSRIGLIKAVHVSQITKIARFLVTGGLAAFIHVGMLYLLTEYARLWYIYSNILAFFIAFIFNFFSQKYWVFRDRAHESISWQMPLHFAVALFNLGLNTLLLYTFVEYFGMWYVLAQALASVIIAVESFVVYRLIFKTPRTVVPLSDR